MTGPDFLKQNILILETGNLATLLPVLLEAAEGEGVSHWLQESVWQTTPLYTCPRTKGTRRVKINRSRECRPLQADRGPIKRSDEEEADFVTEHAYCFLNNYKLKLLP